MPTFERNSENNKLIIAFSSVPENTIRNELKENGFNWDWFNKCWYAEETPERLAIVYRLCEYDAAEPSAEETIVSKFCCFSSLIEDFIGMDKYLWLEEMKFVFSHQYSLRLDLSQEEAWKDSFNCLQDYLSVIDEKNKKFGIIFEYALPYESGRRPDVLLVSEEQVFVLEFKMKSSFLPEDIDQVASYARDIREYHYESRNKEIIPVLVLTKLFNEAPTELPNGVITISANYLPKLINKKSFDKVTPCDLNCWMNSKYEPLPTIVDAAKMFMKNEELPNIRRVNSTGIPEAVQFLEKLTNDARDNNKHVLALVTGVPGAGKTFLGLKFVYDVCKSNENVNSVYLSGNGPLIKVLSNALNSNVFVKNIHKVINEYIFERAEEFDKNILVFDEGQRAWDRNHMYIKKQIDMSEPDVLVELADRTLDWAVLLILVGEGQEINNGENSGVDQWNTALNRSEIDWEVVCPEKLVNIFENDHSVTLNNYLNLNTTLRSYLAGDVSKFVNLIIEGDINEAAALSESIIAAGFNMYVTRNLKAAKNYCTKRYAGNDTKRYGLMASSKAYNLSRYNMKPEFQPDVAKWFNKQPSENGSCCQLSITISEFDCQGLEIDMPIIGWGSDMLWRGDGWSKYKDNEPYGSDTNTYRLNSYRVLLTRGRDGFIIFIPEEAEFDSTFETLLNAGIKKLN